MTMLSDWVGLVKVTELAEDQTLSFKLPSMVTGERVLRAEIELVVGAFTVRVNVEILVIDPPVAVTVIV